MLSSTHSPRQPSAKPHSSHTEQFIVDALRSRGELSLSLVAEKDRQVVGHVALSPVTISDGSTGWFGLGSNLGAARMAGAGCRRGADARGAWCMREQGAQGCVLLGEPAYYGRFGFRAEPGLVLPGVPPEYFQALCLRPPMAQGEVQYSPAFEATA